MWILAILSIVSGFFIRKIGKEKQDKLKEYEFKHRTAGGVVEFANYEDSKAHNKAWRASNRVVGLGNGLIGFAFFLVAIKTLVMR